MKRWILILFSLFVLSVLGYGTGMVVAYIFPPKNETTTEQDEVHVFLEAYATNPALSQMIEFAQLPPQTKKLIAWHRFPNRKSALDLNAYNATEVVLPAREGLWRLATQIMLNAVQDIAQKQPNAVFVIHVNFSHIPIALKPFLDELPRHRIKRIHLYEDGYGSLFKSDANYLNNENFYAPDLIKQTQKALKDDTIKWGDWHTFGLRHLYPVTYHFWNAEEIKKTPWMTRFYQSIRDADIQSVNFDVLQQTLSSEQKNIVYRLSGFDEKKYHALMKGKKSFFYIMGYHFDNEKRLEAEQYLLSWLKGGKSPYLKNPEEFVWFYKPHPSYSAQIGIDSMRTLFPDVVEVPAQLPFEVFVLAGLKPTLTAGFSSSLFYVLNSKDILLYIRRSGDTYMPYLIESGRLNKEQTMDLNQFINLPNQEK